MSEVIPEKGVCRIDFESTDKDDNYCLDVDADSEIDQSDTSSFGEEKIQLIEYGNSNTNYYWNESIKKKDKVVKRIIEYSSESECEDAKRRNKLSCIKQSDEKEKSLQFQNVADLSNLLEPDLSNLLENDNNTIRKSLSHQHKNDLLENIKVPDIQNNCIIDSQSYLEMTDAVRRLTEVLVLPINHSKIEENYFQHQKESVFLERENMFDNISIPETTLKPNSDSWKNPSPSLVCFETSNAEHSLRSHRSQEENCVTLLGENFQTNAIFETNNTTLYKSSQQLIAERDIKDVDFANGSDDTMDFNMAVEALNLLKNKGRIYSNSLDGCKQSLQSIDAADCTMSDKSKVTNEQPLPDSINEHFPSCSNADKSRIPLFDSTLQITDCATGAIIPFESIYQSNNNFSKTDENEFSEKEIPNDTNNISNAIIQLSDTVTCVKVPLHQKDYRSNLPSSTTRRKNEFKTKNVTKQWSQKLRKYIEDVPKVQQMIELSNDMLFSTKKPEEHKNYSKVRPKLLTKKNVESMNKDMKTNIGKGRSSQTSNTSDCSFEHSLEFSLSLTKNVVNAMNEASVALENDFHIGYTNEKCANESNNEVIEAYLSNSTDLKESLDQHPAKPTTQKENEHLLMSSKPKPQLSEAKELTKKIQQNLGSEKIKTPLDAFNLTINDSMIKRIVQYTNEKLLGASKNITVWGYKKATNEIELKAFIGLLLISAALKQNNVKVAELWSECFGATIYKTTFQEGRFYILLHNICFGDVTSTNKASKQNKFRIRDPWEEYLHNCKSYPMPRVSVKAQNNADEDSRQPYTTFRKTTSLSLSVLFSMLDSAIIRGAAIFQKDNPNSVISIRTFFKQVGMALVKPQLKENLVKGTINNSTRELIQRILNNTRKSSCNIPLPVVDHNLKKQKRCQLCSWNKDKKTRHQCICCLRYMCKEHRAKLCIQCIDLM